MLIDASTSTSAPPAISKMNSTGSVRWSLAREFLRGREHPGGDDLVVEQEAGDVDVVHARVVDDHVAGVVRRHGRVAVPRVEHQRRADLAAVDRRLHGPVALVVAAHEPDHDVPLAARDLRVEDALARLAGGGQRLLAEHLLARRDGGEHVLLVRGSPGGDDDRVHLGVVDELLPGLQRLGRRQVRRDRLGPVEVHVRHRGDTRARDDVRDSPDVVLPDHAHADDADVEGHGKSFQLKGRRNQ